VPPNGFEAREAHRGLSTPLVTAYLISIISASKSGVYEYDDEGSGGGGS
jgi:hypothetical protein